MISKNYLYRIIVRPIAKMGFVCILVHVLTAFLIESDPLLKCIRLGRRPAYIIREEDRSSHKYGKVMIKSGTVVPYSWKFSRSKNFADCLSWRISRVKFLRIGTSDCYTHNAYLNFRGSSKILDNSENFTPRKFLAIRYALKQLNLFSAHETHDCTDSDLA